MKIDQNEHKNIMIGTKTEFFKDNRRTGNLKTSYHRILSQDHSRQNAIIF